MKIFEKKCTVLMCAKDKEDWLIPAQKQDYSVFLLKKLRHF